MVHEGLEARVKSTIKGMKNVVDTAFNLVKKHRQAYRLAHALNSLDIPSGEKSIVSKENDKGTGILSSIAKKFSSLSSIERWAYGAPLAAAALMSGCVAIGIDIPSIRRSINFGPKQDVRFCVYKTDNVSNKRVDEIIEAISKEYAPYNLNASLVWTRDWKRKGFFTYFDNSDNLKEILATKLEAPCDRNLHLIGYTLADYIWSLTQILPELGGATEDATHTRGYVYVKYPLSLSWPLSSRWNAQHEAMHLLGCGHDLTRTNCYRRIKALKREASQNTKYNFFPGLQHGLQYYEDGRTYYFLTREEVNDHLEELLDKK